MIIRLALVVICLLFPILALAEQPTRQDLKELEQTLRTEQKKQAQLKEEEEQIGKQVGGLKQKLMKSASRVQSLEKELETAEEQLADLGGQESQLQKDIAKKRKSLIQVTASWLRLARTPPELLLFAPLEPVQILHAGAVFHHVVPRLYTEAEKAKTDLEKLQVLQTELQAKKDNAELLRTSLTSSQEELAALLAEQEEKKSATTAARTAQEKRIKEMGAEAADLRDLLDRLEKEKAARKQAGKTPAKKAKTGLNPNLLPVAGTVKRNYGEKDEVGVSSRGVQIVARSGATVTAPFSGEIQYAGNFRSYGNIVILTRDDGIHALLSGFQKIHGKLGDQINKGEPLGTLPAKTKPVLYIEYRQGTETIDPNTLNLSDSKR